MATRFILPILSALSLVAFGSGASASDFVIDGASTATNGGNILNDGDSLSVTSSGSIATTDAHGIDDNGTAGPLVVRVDGSVSVNNTGPVGLDAIDIDSPATITISGNVSANGFNGNGVDVDDGSNVTLSSGGRISTTGQNGNGFEADNNNVIVIDGTITTDGFGSDGIVVSNDNLITINGTVEATGPFRSEALEAEGDNIIIVNGTLRTQGDESAAIAVGYDNRVTINGTLETFGIDSPAIVVVSPDNEITVTGRVTSAFDDAFRVLDTGTILTLGAPAFLAGEIDFGQPSTVNIATGASHSVYWTFEGSGGVTGGAPTVSGPVAGFWNSTEGSFATYDPTRFSASFDVLADMSRLIASGLPGYFASSANAPTAVLSSSHGEDAKEGANPALHVWANAAGSFKERQGSDQSLDRAISNVAISTGATLYQSDAAQIGVAGGYVENGMTASSQTTSSYDNRASGVFGGLYGSAYAGDYFLHASSLVGWLSHSDKRFVNDNLASTGGLYTGIDTAKSDYDSWWFSQSIAAGRRFALSEGVFVTPALRARYASEWIDGFKETGSNANARVSSAQIGLGEAAFDIAVEKIWNRKAVSAHAGLKHRVRIGGRRWHLDFAERGSPDDEIRRS